MERRESARDYARDLVQSIDAEVDAILIDPIRLARECCHRGRAWPYQVPDTDPQEHGPMPESPRASVIHVVAARLCPPGTAYRVVDGLDGSALVVIGSLGRRR